MVARRALTLIVLALVPLALVPSGCDEDPCPERSMLDSPEGLVVTELEHGFGAGAGWGEADCARCHAVDRLHRVDCAGVDLSEVRAIVREEGMDSCATCHGANGTDLPVDEDPS